MCDNMTSSLLGYLASMEGSICPPIQLIDLIKLLGSGNPALNQLYLKLVNSAITRCYEQQTQLEECRHLIWLIFRHPAFTVPERATLLHWVEVFDRMFPPLQHLESESGYSSGGSDRSSSCSPSPTQDKMFVYNPGMVNQFPNLFPGFPTPPHQAAPPLYQSCRRTNGMIFKRSHSEPAGQFNGRCRVQQRERSLDVTQHMTALMSWLKTLRLHKYYSQLSNLTYDDMLSLNADKLRDITEGARRKILLNIQKLVNRHQVLAEIKEDLSKPGRFHMCMTDMHNMLMKTPFRLPGPNVTDADTSELIIQYTSILEAAGNYILANNIDEDSQKLFFKLLEDAGQHAAFPEKQRRVVMDILQQCIDNFNYRNGQIVQPKRFDNAVTTATGPQANNLLKIKYPIKPVNGTNHQTNNYTSASKFQRPKFTWQNRVTSPALHTASPLSAPVTPSACGPFPYSIWGQPGPGPATTEGRYDQLDMIGLESLCSKVAECALSEK